MTRPVIDIRRFGWQPQPYRPVWRAMQDFAETRATDTRDALWLLNHEPVFTQGKRGAPNICSPRATSRSCQSTAAAKSPTTAPARSWLM